MGELSAGRKRGIQNYWPFLAGGIVAPILANVVTRWFPLPYAVAGCNFVAWFAAISLFERAAGPSRMGMLGRLAVSAAAGLAAGVLAFLFPWK